MIAAIRSELAKVFTTRAWWILLLVMVPYLGFNVGIIAFLFGFGGDSVSLAAGSLSPIDVLIALAGSKGYVFPLLIGSLIVTAEYRNKTIVPTFLAQPSRPIVLGAKVVVGAVVGIGFGIVGVVAALAIGGGVLLAVSPSIVSAVDVALIFRVIVLFALWAVIGVGLGSLIVNQAAAIVIVLVFTLLVEPLLRVVAIFWDWSRVVSEYLPGSAADTFTGASLFTSGQVGSTADGLSWWAAGLVLAGYAVVFPLIAAVTRVRTDVA